MNAQQNEPAIGLWRSHVPYKNALKVVDAGDRIWCASSTGLFFYSKEDGAVHTLNKATGLSESGIASIAYNASTKSLVIAYANSNIDIINQNDEIINLPDIKRKSILGSKEINNIYMIGNQAYLACGFGIVVVNTKAYEISDTYYIGPNGDRTAIYDIASSDSLLYASSDNGIQYININNPNKSNFFAWNYLPIPGKKYTELEIHNKQLFCVSSDGEAQNKDNGNDTLKRYFNKQLSAVDTLSQGTHIISINSSRGHLFVCTSSKKAFVYDSNLQFEKKIDEYFYQEKSNFALLDNENTLWIADGVVGLVKRNFDLKQYAVF